MPNVGKETGKWKKGVWGTGSAELEAVSDFQRRRAALLGITGSWRGLVTSSRISHISSEVINQKESNENGTTFTVTKQHDMQAEKVQL